MNRVVVNTVIVLRMVCTTHKMYVHGFDVVIEHDEYTLSTFIHIIMIIDISFVAYSAHTGVGRRACTSAATSQMQDKNGNFCFL